MYTQIKNLTYGKKYQNLCRVPYHNHPKGCPNYGKRDDCPPCELISDRFDVQNEIYVIFTSYPVGEFAEKLRQAHPEWSETPRQWYNCIRWQGTARKLHRADLKEFQDRFPDLIVDQNPEALGIDVTEMMRQVGIELEWNYHEEHDRNRITYRVSVGGTKLN